MSLPVEQDNKKIKCQVEVIVLITHKSYTMHIAINTILSLYREKGGSEYGGEAVTQLQHALQCATLAVQANAGAALVTAALVHDIGHLMHDLPDDAPEQGVDDAHETAASGFLEKYFIPAVTEPVGLHVLAKRYLCTVSTEYFALLSPPSVVSLELQGGLLNEDEVARFEKNEFFGSAVQLRKWDDIAKDAMAITPPLESFMPYVELCLQEEN